MSDLQVTVGDIELEADWLDRNHELREAVAEALPIGGEGRRWGDEVYFTANIDGEATDRSVEVDPGTIAFWPDGPAICLFWGPTPASTDDTPVAASPVAPFALVRDVDQLAELDGAAAVRLRRA